MSDTPTTPAQPTKKAAPKRVAKPSVGSTHEIKTKGVAEVVRPNGDKVLVHSVDGIALYVLDVPGEYTVLVSERGPVKVEAV